VLILHLAPKRDSSDRPDNQLILFSKNGAPHRVMMITLSTLFPSTALLKAGKAADAASFC